MNLIVVVGFVLAHTRNEYMTEVVVLAVVLNAVLCFLLGSCGTSWRQAVEEGRRLYR